MKKANGSYLTAILKQHCRIKSFLMALFLFTAPFNLIAQTATSPNCKQDYYKQFDFWIGKWTVADLTGKVVGHNEIKKVHEGCGLLENWKSLTNYSGTSINAYSRADQKWHQTWIDTSGTLLILSGNYKQGKMVLSDQANSNSISKSSKINRITWKPLENGKVRQTWEISTDNGKKWKEVFNGLYTRDDN